MDSDDRPMKALYEHCINVYERMLEEAAPPEEPDGPRLYEGHLTQIFQELQLSTPYYTSVLRTLKSMGCIEQVKRGGGNARSKWVLICAPTEEGFQAVDGRATPKQGSHAALQQQVAALTKRVAIIELAIGLRREGT